MCRVNTGLLIIIVFHESHVTFEWDLILVSSGGYLQSSGSSSKSRTFTRVRPEWICASYKDEGPFFGPSGHENMDSQSVYTRGTRSVPLRSVDTGPRTTGYQSGGGT